MAISKRLKKIMTINEKQDQIIEEFGIYDEWMDKYTYLIELGNSLAPLFDNERIPENLIKGCQSQLWLTASLQNGKIIFKADSDAILTKGLIFLFITILSNHTPDEIISADLYFIDAIGLKEHLSPTRSNGLVAMVKQIRFYALAFKSKSTN
jgi:cysteine desulfuration protein SufE